jgi:DUF4097 and DUF4098 domain-containing protein YvlB
MYKQVLLFLLLGLVAAAARADVRVDENRFMNTDGRIQIIAVTGEFEIVGSDSDQLVITGTLGTDVREMTIEGDEGYWTVELHAIQSQGRMYRGSTRSRLTILVPLDAEVEASTVSGNLKADNLSGRRVSLQSVSGSVRLDRAAPEWLEVQTVSGGQQLKSGGTHDNRLRSVSGNIEASELSGRISANSVSGNIRIEGFDANDVEAETVSGRIRLDLTPASGARYRVSSHGGSIELSLPSATPLALRANTFSGRIDSAFGGDVRRGRGPGEQLDHRVGDGSVRVDSKTFSGSIQIRHRD